MGKKLADEGDEVRIKVIWPEISISGFGSELVERNH